MQLTVHPFMETKVFQMPVPRSFGASPFRLALWTETAIGLHQKPARCTSPVRTFVLWSLRCTKRLMH